MTENEICTRILHHAFALHRTPGPGLLKPVYKRTLAYNLEQSDLSVQTQLPGPLVYKEIKFEAGFKLDLLVENKVTVEIKSIETLAPIHFVQTLIYLKLSGKRLALLFNFYCKYFKEGIYRVVNNL